MYHSIDKLDGLFINTTFAILLSKESDFNDVFRLTSCVYNPNVDKCEIKAVHSRLSQVVCCLKFSQVSFLAFAFTGFAFAQFNAWVEKTTNDASKKRSQTDGFT